MENAVDRFIKHDLEVEAERDSNVISVTLLNHDRELAVKALSRLVDRFLEREAKFGRDPRLEFVKGQVDIYRKQVSDAQTAMEAFQIGHNISSMDEERTVLIQQRANLEQSIIATHARALEDDKKYRSLVVQMKGLLPVVTTEQGDRDPLQLTARSNLADLKATQHKLQQTFSTDSTIVEAIRQRIADAEGLLKEASAYPPLTHSDPNRAYQDVEVAMIQAKADLDAATDSEADQRVQLAMYNSRLAERDREQGEYQNLVREYQLADQNYRIYLQRVQEARVADDLNKQKITTIAVFDVASAPLKPARPRWLLIIVLGAVAGVLLGIVLAFTLEALDERLNTPSQVTAVLGIPTLGSMGRISK